MMIARIAKCVFLMVMSIECALAFDVTTAADLYRHGKYGEARQALQSEFKGAPYTPQARYYDALCLEGLKEGKKFLRKVDALRKDYAQLTPEQREDLDYRYTMMRFRQRTYGEAKASADKFIADYPSSSHLPAVREIAAVALFEVGRKNIIEANLHKAGANDAKEKARRDQGLRELAAFLEAVGPGGSQSQAALELTSPTRMAEMVRMARILTGDSDRLLTEAAAMPVADRETYLFLNTTTRCDYWPDQRNANLQMLEDFARQYPASPRISDIKLRAASLHYELGAILARQANEVTSAGMENDADRLRREAGEHFDRFRAYCRGGLLTTTATLHASDKTDLEEDLLMSYALQGDFQTQLQEARAISGRHQAGTRPWAVAKVHEAMALATITPKDLNGAAAALDAVLAANVEDRNIANHVPTVAAYWRACVAKEMGDTARVEAMLEKIRTEMPDGPKKQEALARLGGESEAQPVPH